MIFFKSEFWRQFLTYQLTMRRVESCTAKYSVVLDLVAHRLHSLRLKLYQIMRVQDFTIFRQRRHAQQADTTSPVASYEMHLMTSYLTVRPIGCLTDLPMMIQMILSLES